MKAAVLGQFGDPLEIRSVPVPQIGPDDVLVRVAAAGICGTDLKLLAGRLPGTRLPLIPGHEIAGRIEAVGSAVTDVSPGDAVAVYFYVGCGMCDYCRRDEQNLCPQPLGRPGFERDGGWAEYVAVPRRHVVHVPEGVAMEAAAIAADAIATSVRAVMKTDAADGERLAIIGVGGLGFHALQVAQRRTPAVDVFDADGSRLESARRLGAAATYRVDGAEVDWSERPPAWGHYDHVIDMAGSPRSWQLALKLVRRGGCVVLVGYDPKLAYPFHPLNFIRHEVRLFGSRGSSRADLATALTLLAEGSVEPAIAHYTSLDDLEDALSRLRNGLPGRVVIRF